jgi:hypothetical protein
MPIPNALSAYVPPEKLTGYLLDEQHPVGGPKAKWLIGHGYDAADPSPLERDLLSVVHASDDSVTQQSRFGTKYVVVGRINAPDGQQVDVTTVWIVEPPDDRPRFVTAYPGS